MPVAAGDSVPQSRVRGGYRFPPGLERNLLWFALRKFKPADPIELFTHLAREYGDIAHYRIGPANIIFVNHPDYIREVLIQQPEKFVKERTQRRSKMLLGEGMITSEDPLHRQQRQVSQPAFHRQRIAGYAQTMVARAAAMCDGWGDGETRDIALEMQHLALDIVARTLFGSDLHGDVHAVAAAINRIMRMYNYLVALPAAEVLVHMPLSGLGKFTRARAEVDRVVYQMIDRRMIDARRRTLPAADNSGSDGNGDLLSMMLGAEAQFDRQNLRDQVVTIFLAGYETVANALAWTWYLLAQNPQVEQKLHDEVDRVLGGRAPLLPSVDDVPRLAYTEMVFAESMRLYPPAWAMGRQATQDFALGDYFLPRGTTVLMSQFLLHRDARFFPEPLEFRPERFAPEVRPSPAKFTYLPFGAGARRCIGEAYAWMQGVLLLATIAQGWRMRLAPGQRVAPQPLITLRPKFGLRMQLERRVGTTAHAAAAAACAGRI